MNRYDGIADWYDAYVRTDRDLAYFQHLARDASAVLDLMAGTGRVAMAMAAASRGVVTCVDRSVGMLQVLRRKVARGPNIRAVCADVSSLPLRCRFDLAVIPFNSLAEILGRAGRRAVLQDVRDVLVPGGRFICTLHNPDVRRETLDGVSRRLGPFLVSGDTSLEMTVTGTLDSSGEVATSEQQFRMVDGKGKVTDERRQVVHFALISRNEVEQTAQREGFELEALHGDYDGSAFARDSPFLIWQFRRGAASDR